MHTRDFVFFVSLESVLNEEMPLDRDIYSPNGVCIIDGLVYIGMDESELVRIDGSCFQKEEERVLSDVSCMRRGESLPPTYQWVIIHGDLSALRKTQSQSDMIGRNARRCRPEFLRHFEKQEARRRRKEEEKQRGVEELITGTGDGQQGTGCRMHGYAGSGKCRGRVSLARRDATLLFILNHDVDSKQRYGTRLSDGFPRADELGSKWS